MDDNELRERFDELRKQADQLGRDPDEDIHVSLQAIVENIVELLIESHYCCQRVSPH